MYAKVNVGQVDPPSINQNIFLSLDYLSSKQVFFCPCNCEIIYLFNSIKDRSTSSWIDLALANEDNLLSYGLSMVSKYMSFEEIYMPQLIGDLYDIVRVGESADKMEEANIILSLVKNLCLYHLEFYTINNLN